MINILPQETDQERQWGGFLTFIKNKKCTVKILIINPNQRTSLQRHQNRAEYWYVLEGSVSVTYQIGKDKCQDILNPMHQFNIGKKVIHRLACVGKKPVKILEIAQGHFDEEDIERFHDDYGRT